MRLATQRERKAKEWTEVAGGEGLEEELRPEQRGGAGGGAETRAEDS